MPVVLTKPPGTARPCACVAASTSPQVAPPPHTARRPAGSTATSPQRAEVDHQPVVADGEPGEVVAPAAHRELQPARRAKRRARRHVARAGAARDQGGTAPDVAVPHRGGAGAGVARIGGRDDRAVELGAQGLQVALCDRSHERPRPPPPGNELAPHGTAPNSTAPPPAWQTRPTPPRPHQTRSAAAR